MPSSGSHRKMGEGLWDNTKVDLLREWPENHIFGTSQEAVMVLGLCSQITWVLESNWISNHYLGDLGKILLSVSLSVKWKWKPLKFVLRVSKESGVWESDWRWSWKNRAWSWRLYGPCWRVWTWLQKQGSQRKPLGKSDTIGLVCYKDNWWQCR